MTQTVDPQTARTPAAHRRLAGRFEAALAAGGRDGGGGPVRDRVLLARPGVVHLEHHDRRGPRRGGRPGRRDRRRRSASGFATSEPPDEADGVVDRVDRFRDRHRSRQRPAPAGRGGRPGPGVDAAHHALRAEGPRGAARHAPADGRRARRRQAPGDLEGAPPAGGGEPRQHHAAVRARDRRRPGRHRAGLPAAAARRPGSRHRQAPATGRPVAQPLQVAVPARPGLVRPPAVPEVPGQLAGVRAQGQDRRLARVLRPGDGGAVLVEHRRHQRHLVGGETGVDGGGRARGPPLTLRPKQLVFATGMCGKPRIPDVPGIDVSAATTPLLRAPRTRRVRRQKPS